MLHTSQCSTVQFSVSLASFTFFRKDNSFKHCFLFLLFWGGEYVNVSFMAADSRHAWDGWMSLSFRPAWPISGLNQSAFFHHPPSHPSLKCEVWSSQLCAVIEVIGLKMESSLSLCHPTKKQFVFNEFFFFKQRPVKNNIISKQHLTAMKRGWGWWRRHFLFSVNSGARSCAG